MEYFVPNKLILCVLIVSNIPALSLESRKDLSPKSQIYNENISQQIHSIVLAEVDNAELKSLYSSNERKTGRFGHERWLPVNLKYEGTWDNITDGRILRLQITSPNALGLRVYFNKFWLPENATLHFYDSSGAHILGAYTSANNRNHGEFISPSIPGAIVTIEYYEPAGSDLAILEIHNIVHKFSGDCGSPASCNIRVNCPEGAPWRTERDASVHIITATGCCSGTLLNNLEEDLTPYVLTAEHCLDPYLNVWDMTFHNQYLECSGSGVRDPVTFTGATLRASWDGSDFALLELNDPLSTLDSVAFSGWDRSGAAAEYTVGIHHPLGSDTKISFDEWIPGTGMPPWHNHWEVLWDAGITEGGSSGSGLFNQDRLLIGQLDGGTSHCSGGFDRYGKLSASWDGNGTTSTRLKDWLDPQSRDKNSVKGLVHYPLTVTGTYDNREHNQRWGLFRSTQKVEVKNAEISDHLEVVAGSGVVIRSGVRVANGKVSIKSLTFGSGPPLAKPIAKTDTVDMRENVLNKNSNLPWKFQSHYLPSGEIFVSLTLQDNSTIFFHVFDVSGRTLVSEKWNLSKGEHTKSVRLAKLSRATSTSLIARILVQDNAGQKVNFLESQRIGIHR